MKENDTIGTYWKAVGPVMKEESRKRKEANKDRGWVALFNAGYQPQWKSDTHLVVSIHGFTWDYWPSTGKWSRRVKGPKQSYSRGIRSLLSDIESKNPTPQHGDEQ